MFSTNNHASFHLWWKENLVKYQKISKYLKISQKISLHLVNLKAWASRKHFTTFLFNVMLTYRWLIIWVKVVVLFHCHLCLYDLTYNLLLTVSSSTLPDVLSWGIYSTLLLCWCIAVFFVMHSRNSFLEFLFSLKIVDSFIRKVWSF